MSKKNYDNLINQTFGRLIVKEIIYNKNTHTKAKCVCECGKEDERIINTPIQVHRKGV